MEKQVDKPPVEKRGPGRPRKTIVVEQSSIKGVIQTPVKPDNRVEMEYHNPASWKSIIDLHDGYGVVDVIMLFDKTKIYMATKDRLNKSNIYVITDCTTLDSYCCTSPIEVTILRKDLQIVFGTMTKSYKKVYFELRSDYLTKLKITLHGSDHGVIETFLLDVKTNTEHAFYDELDNDNDYPLKFTVLSKCFKQKVAALSKISKVMMIQHGSEFGVQITHDPASINWTSQYPDGTLIDLASTCPHGGFISASINIDYILPFTSASLGDHISIAVHPEQRMSFTTKLDKFGQKHVFEIKAFTELRRGTLGSYNM